MQGVGGGVSDLNKEIVRRVNREEKREAEGKIKKKVMKRKPVITVHLVIR